MTKEQPYRIIISGGGTGGHIFPAIAIANTFRERYPDAQILFVGAKGKMEMIRVPEAGYKIVGLWISGLQRSLKLSNLLFPVKLVVSYVRAIGIVRRFKPHAVVGTGGYASGPIMMAATRFNIPSLVQEQNSFAGLANKQVANKVSKVCVAYEGMENYFPKNKIVITGNPVRKDILSLDQKRETALTHFGFNAGKKTLLIIGGSLGARTINESILGSIEKLIDAQVQVIWQTGKGYYELYKEQLGKYDLLRVRVQDFVREMDLAYAAADVVVSRSGALSVSELCIAKKPVILVPSPNVAEDHQTKNAMALVSKEAALLVTDKEAKTHLVDEALKLLFDGQRSAKLSENIALFAKPNATNDIVSEIEKLIKKVKLENYHNIYFLGIGGIGMSALARWFMKSGLKVSGYDKTATPLTNALKAEGMVIHFDDNLEAIPLEVKNERENTLVIFTPAIPKDHKEYNFLKDNGYAIMKRSEVLGLISKGYKTIGVAGTHGKTTTSSMLAHILKTANKSMVAFLGGITTNYSSNLVMEGEVTKDTIVVAEADEFDRSFLRLFPEIAIITSADADHLDIYGDHESLIVSFKDFIKQIKPDGSLVIHESIDELLAQDVTHVTKYIYSMSRGQFFAGSITAKSGFFEFDLNGFGKVEHIRLGVPGFHNIENAIAASVAAYKCGVSLNTIKQALESFQGVKRRFEFILKGKKVIYVDDYAHHPTELEAFLRSMKSMYPQRKLTAIFQPHLFTRTRDFAAGFSKSLSIADEVLLMDIYPARELPILGVDSDMLFKDITSKHKIRCNKGNLMETITALHIDVLVTVGAGDIDTFIEPIKNMLNTKYEV